MSEHLAPDVRAEDWVSMIRDRLIPETVQRLIAAMANIVGPRLRDHVLPRTFQDASERVRQMPDREKATLTRTLLEEMSWQELCVTLTALRCLEDACRSGEYGKPLPVDPVDLVLVALDYQVEVQNS